MVRRLTLEAGDWPKDGRWIVTLARLADVAADVGDKEFAEALYPMLESFADQAVAGGSGTVASEGAVSRHLGRLALLGRRLDVAEGHFRKAITLDEHTGARPFAAMSRMYLAAVLQSVAAHRTWQPQPPLRGRRWPRCRQSGCPVEPHSANTSWN